jgi:hypothetical protein
MATFFNDMVHIVRESVNYASIMRYKNALNQGRCRGEKLSVKDFLALSSGNDPFYAGSPSGETWGKWFAEQWNEHKSHQAAVHVRGLHYALVGMTNSDRPVYMPDGKVYENTEKCWKKLERAGKYARYNQYIDAERFEDRRAQTLYERVYDYPFHFINTTDPIADEDFKLELPKFPDLPEYTLNFRNRQRYRLEVWCEKSTQETVLRPVADKYQVTMLSAQGELSISAMLKAIARAEDYSRLPTRILYISDFDPAGRSMPVAASRKLEFLQSIKHSHADIQLYPIALTHEQCISYQLERTPIKESEKRKGKFEERYGTGATELDALEAKHPGELANLLESEILKFYDDTLSDRTEEEKDRLNDELVAIQDRIHDEYQGDALKEEYEQLKAEFEEWKAARWTPFQERLTDAWQGIKESLEDEMPDIDEYPLPEVKEVPAGDTCLYDSAREYLQQIAAYNAFTGKFSYLIDDEDADDIA